METTSAAVMAAVGSGMGEYDGVAVMKPGVSPAATTALTAVSVFFALCFFFIMLFWLEDYIL